MNLQYTITPTEIQGAVGYQLTGPGIDGSRQVLWTQIAQLADTTVRQQLIRAGWASPEMIKVSDSLNRLAISQRDEAWLACSRKDALLRQCLEALETDDWMKKLQAAIDIRKELQA